VRRPGDDSVGGAASCAPRAHGGFWVRPAYGVGAMACVRVGVMGSGSAGIGGDRAPRLGQTACSMTQNHRSPKSIQGDENRGSIRAIPLTGGVMRACKRVWGSKP